VVRMIDAYLDQLLLELRGRTRDVRRVLSEVEEHLRDATAAGVEAGLEPAEAERRAIEEFGSPKVVARRFEVVGPWLPWPALRELASAVVLLAGIGLIAIGVSGAVAMGFRAAMGSDFVAADPPGLTYTAARCADFRKYHPEAKTCEAAAAAHHADEVGEYRVAAGGLGVVVLGGWWLVRRWSRRGAAATVAWLPDEFVSITGLALFGFASVALTVQTLGTLTFGAGAGGAGQWLSGAVVSMVATALFAWSLLRTLRVRVAVLSPA
jgi:HAAS